MTVTFGTGLTSQTAQCCTILPMMVICIASSCGCTELNPIGQSNSHRQSLDRQAVKRNECVRGVSMPGRGKRTQHVRCEPLHVHPLDSFAHFTTADNSSKSKTRMASGSVARVVHVRPHSPSSFGNAGSTRNSPGGSGSGNDNVSVIMKITRKHLSCEHHIHPPPTQWLDTMLGARRGLSFPLGSMRV